MSSGTHLKEEAERRTKGRGGNGREEELPQCAVLRQQWNDCAAGCHEAAGSSALPGLPFFPPLPSPPLPPPRPNPLTLTSALFPPSSPSPHHRACVHDSKSAFRVNICLPGARVGGALDVPGDMSPHRDQCPVCGGSCIADGLALPMPKLMAGCPDPWLTPLIADLSDPCMSHLILSSLL